MPAADHQKRVGVVHIAAAGHQSDRLLAGVDQIPVDLVIRGRRPDTENAVFAMQHYFAVGGEKLGDQGRQTDPEIDIGALGEILRGPPGDLTTFERHRDFLYAKPSIQTVEMGYPIFVRSGKRSAATLRCYAGLTRPASG